MDLSGLAECGHLVDPIEQVLIFAQGRGGIA
jgi:hypothetical protein